MPKISPFKATFPAPGYEKLVAVNTHIHLTEAELTAHLESNPFSYLHIFKPQGHFAPHDKTGKFFSFGKNYYQQLKEQKVLVQEEKEAIYLYQIKQTDGSKFLGIIANVDAKDYAQNLIKKHENTLVAKEDLLVKHIAETNLIGEPVLLTYPASEEVSQVFKEQTQREPELSFETEDSSVHSFWKINQSDVILTLQKAFANVAAFYIADGHHRCASMYKYINQNDCGSCSMLAYLVSDEQMRIYPFYRTLALEHQPNWNHLLSILSTYFSVSIVQEGSNWEVAQDEIGVITPDTHYILKLKPDYATGIHSVLDTLNVVILEKYVLQACFDVNDSRDDKRLSYVSGKVPFNKMKEACQNGEFSMFFVLAPLSPNAIFEVSDAGLTMPPKSTYVEPKMHSGAIILEFNQQG